jgi:Rps23 Pro-64 3,4-dihydroxylase Tpa1-like proline 4-hydroxylase
VGLFYFDPDALLPLARSRHEEFVTAEPFPHAVFDGLVPGELLNEILDEFPEALDERWFRFEHSRSHKLAMNEDWLTGPITRQVLMQFNSAVFVNFLEELTGISNLVPDPRYIGGGLHQIERSGFLKIHTDFNYHSIWDLDRRINAIIYLNPDWDPAWGGQLEMWNDQMTDHLAIDPLFNRLVVFATTDTSKHGHPDPLESPPGISRRSLAFYYYTKGRPESERRKAHSTEHFQRPGEIFEESGSGQFPKPSAMKTLALDLVPPVVLRKVVDLRARIKDRKTNSR